MSKRSKKVPPKSASPPARRWWWRWRVWGWIAFVGGALLCLMLLALPLAVRWGMQHWLRTHGKPDAAVLDVSLSLFHGELTIQMLEDGASQDAPRLALGLGNARLDWRRLWDRRVVLPMVALEGVRLDLVRTEQGLNIGGLDLGNLAPAELEDEAGPTSAGEPWGLTVEAVRLHNVLVTYQDGDRCARAYIEEGWIDG